MPLRRSPRPTARALEARRQNALKSTGPRTPRGKGRVRFNSLRHGRRSAHLAGFVARMGLGWRLIRGLDKLSRGPDEALVGPVLRPLVRRWLAVECGPGSRELERFERRLHEREEKARRQATELVNLIRELLAARGVRVASPPAADGAEASRNVSPHRTLEGRRERQNAEPAGVEPEGRERAKLECAMKSGTWKIGG